VCTIKATILTSSSHGNAKLSQDKIISFSMQSQLFIFLPWSPEHPSPFIVMLCLGGWRERHEPPDVRVWAGGRHGPCRIEWNTTVLFFFLRASAWIYHTMHLKCECLYLPSQRNPKHLKLTILVELGLEHFGGLIISWEASLVDHVKIWTASFCAWSRHLLNVGWQWLEYPAQKSRVILC